jgi:hypothetical protein
MSCDFSVLVVFFELGLVRSQCGVGAVARPGLATQVIQNTTLNCNSSSMPRKAAVGNFENLVATKALTCNMRHAGRYVSRWRRDSCMGSTRAMVQQLRCQIGN